MSSPPTAGRMSNCPQSRSPVGAYRNCESAATLHPALLIHCPRVPDPNSPRTCAGTCHYLLPPSHRHSTTPLPGTYRWLLLPAASPRAPCPRGPPPPTCRRPRAAAATPGAPPAPPAPRLAAATPGCGRPRGARRRSPALCGQGSATQMRAADGGGQHVPECGHGFMRCARGRLGVELVDTVAVQGVVRRCGYRKVCAAKDRRGTARYRAWCQPQPPT